MMTKRIGKWAWALSAQERVVAAVVDAARGDTEGIGARIRRAHDAMLVKQKKLLARQQQDGIGSGFPTNRTYPTVREI
jgi:hypothetical protein